MPAANEGASQTDSRQTERLSDGQTEACTNETKSDGGIEDFWGGNGCHGKNYSKEQRLIFRIL